MLLINNFKGIHVIMSATILNQFYNIPFLLYYRTRRIMNWFQWNALSLYTHVIKNAKKNTNIYVEQLESIIQDLTYTLNH